MAHPPGYPLFTMLLRLIMWLPVGSPAWRGNFLCAITASFANAVIASMVTKLLDCSHRIVIGICAALAWGFMPHVSLYAVSAEVFALNNLLVAMAMYIAAYLGQIADIHGIEAERYGLEQIIPF